MGVAPSRTGQLMSGNNARSYRREKTAVRIAQDIVRQIRRDGRQLGAHLPPERVMLEEYGVGRGTLREALRYLELQGVLDIKPGPGGGPIVRAPDSANLENTLALLLEFSDARFRTIAETRLAIEPMVARLSADRMSPELLDELEESVELMEQQVEDRAVFLEQNRRFHDLIAWGSRNPLFANLIESVIAISDGYAFGTDYPLHRREKVCTAHRAIYEAIRAKDEDAAADRMHAHVAAFLRYVEVKYPEVLDAPVTWEEFIS